MSDTHYISEKKEVPPSTEQMAGHVITQEMTPVEKMIPLEASIESAAVSEERLPKQETEIKQEKHDLRKTTQRRRTSAQLSQLLKQAKRNEFEINQMRKSIESLDRVDRVSARSNLQLMKQLRLQLGQLRNQVMRIQKDLRRIRTSPSSNTSIRKNKLSGGRAKHTLRIKKGELAAHSSTKRRRNRTR